jgi:hypothetical protein
MSYGRRDFLGNVAEAAAGLAGIKSALEPNNRTGEENQSTEVDSEKVHVPEGNRAYVGEGHAQIVLGSETGAESYGAMLCDLTGLGFEVKAEQEGVRFEASEPGSESIETVETGLLGPGDSVQVDAYELSVENREEDRLSVAPEQGYKVEVSYTGRSF